MGSIWQNRGVTTPIVKSGDRVLLFLVREFNPCMENLNPVRLLLWFFLFAGFAAIFLFTVISSVTWILAVIITRSAAGAESTSENWSTGTTSSSRGRNSRRNAQVCLEIARSHEFQIRVASRALLSGKIHFNAFFFLESLEWPIQRGQALMLLLGSWLPCSGFG
jgi:hypothetical protein